MKVSLLLFIAAFFPSIVHSETIDVRSGEHDGFTRLVLPIGSGTNWSVENKTEERKFVIDIPKKGVKFDLNSVFDRIGRERISSFERQEKSGLLEVKLACDCEAKSFIYGERYLVIDVMPADAVSSAEYRIPQDDPIETTAAVEEPERVSEESRREIDAIPLLTGRTSRSFTNTAADSIELSRQNVHSQETASISDVSQLSSQIATDLAAAATKGLLNPSVNPDASDFANIGVKKSTNKHEDGVNNSLGASGYIIENSEGLISEKSGRLYVGGSDCILEDDINIGAWGGDVNDIAKEISKSRNEMVDEFDQIDVKSLKHHVRSLIYIGFGAEARQAMALSPQMESKVLLALSYLVDLEDDPTDFFQDQLQCESSSSLWSVLDAQPKDGLPSPEPAAVLHAFEALPKHLREHIGPKLSERLTQFGDTNTARDVLRRLERAQGEETESIALERARINVAEGKFEQAQDSLHDLATKPGPEALDALTEAVALADMKDLTVPNEYVELLGAYSTELRNSEDGSIVWEDYVVSMIVNDDLIGAVSTFLAGEAIDEKVYESVKERLLEEIISSTDDEIFLKLAFMIGAGDLEDRYLDDRLEIAERLIDIGFADLAYEILETSPTQMNFREIQILKSKALIKMNKPQEAEVILIGRQGSDIDMLRAEARRQMGDHEYTQRVFSELGDESRAHEAAILAGDWESLESTNDRVLSSVAQMLRARQTQVDPDNITLDLARQLTDQTTSSSQTIRDLLDATEVERE